MVQQVTSRNARLLLDALRLDALRLDTLRLGVIWLIVSVARPGYAQPVNAEGFGSELLADGFSGAAEGKLSVSRGNVDVVDVGASGLLQYQTLYPQASDERPPFIHQRVLLTGNLRFAERDDEDFVDQGFAHLRWTGMWIPHLGSELFAQYQFNAFQLLELRALGGAGARVEIVHENEIMLWGGSAAMLEFERLDVPQDGPDDPEVTALRWSNFLTARVALGERLTAQNTVYYQPRFTNFGNFRLLDELSLKAQADKVFSLGISLSLLHDSRPPNTVKKTDLTIASTLGASF